MTSAAATAGPSSSLPAPPSILERWRRRPPGVELWVGVGLLALYVAAALSALVVFGSHLSTLTENPAWMPDFRPIGPSWAYPFGILPGFGVNLVDALWQATPWDLGIVFSVLALEAGLALLIGALAGLYEGSWIDTAVTFVGDSLGAVPSVFLVVVLFAGLATVAPHDGSLPVFIVLLALVLWPTGARAVRDRVRLIARAPYVEAARASGAREARVFTRHVLPNALEPILAQVPVDVAAIFFVLTVFPWFYNCAGPFDPSPAPFYPAPVLPPFSPLPSPMFPEWGFMLGFSPCVAFPLDYAGPPTYWWMFLFPLLAIVGLGLAIGLTCDGIDKWLRPPRP